MRPPLRRRPAPGRLRAALAVAVALAAALGAVTPSLQAATPGPITQPSMEQAGGVAAAGSAGSPGSAARGPMAVPAPMAPVAVAGAVLSLAELISPTSATLPVPPAASTAHAEAGAASAAQLRASRSFAFDVAGPGDFVTQYTAVACVGASIQMMLNMMRPGADRQPATQARLLKVAQTQSDRAFVRRIGGASANGWAYALMRAGGGPYRVRAYDTRDEAIRAVVLAIRSTRRPAGLLVWKGAHAWVVSGFRTSGDPASGRFRVAGLVVDDPWWPRALGSHGRTRPPGTLLSPAALRPHFVPFQRGRPSHPNVMNGLFVVVLPIDPAVVRTASRRIL